jgi:hypothetical protein
MFKIKNVNFFNDDSFKLIKNLIKNLEILDLSYTKISDITV